MEQGLIVDVLSRWVHVGTTIVLVGGSVFLRFVLMPAAAELPDADEQALRARVVSIWRKFVGIGIGLLLLSGLYNYWRAVPLHKGEGAYHALIGTKMLLALVVFFLASALTGRAQAFERLRENRKKWLAVTIVLAATVVGLGGIAKVAFRGSAATTNENSAVSTLAEG
jgi:uncharacterized membrane protein